MAMDSCIPHQLLVHVHFRIFPCRDRAFACRHMQLHLDSHSKLKFQNIWVANSRELNGCAKHRVYARKQLQLFLGSYFCQLVFSPFTADQHASKLAVLVCSPFDCSCASSRSHPLPLGKFLAVVCSRYFSLEAV